jgi:hypothetical protein
MVYEKKSRIIIMLTQFEELTTDNTIIEKSYKYLPDLDEAPSLCTGKLTITLLETVRPVHL